MIGEVLDGRYKILRLIGEGGMGAVYEAEHTESGRRVAVKVISTDNLSRSEEVRIRFEREVRAAGGIETRHIVQVLDAGRDPQTNLPFMVMELLAGEDLQTVLERLGPLPEPLVLRAAAQACVGLQRAHDAGVVHRDVKPANLFFSQIRADEASLSTTGASEIIVKLLDFGIAKVKMDQLGAGGQGLTRTGSMLGTPLYMSPEQAKGLKTIDHRTDIWSLGAVLYQALTGLPPHHEDTVGQLILAICSDPPKPVQEVAPWVSPEAASIVQNALRIDPAERFQSATEMLAALSELVGDSWTLSAEMVTPLPEAQRAIVARRVVIVTDSDKRSRPSAEEQGIASTTYIGTTGGVARRLPSVPPRLKRLTPPVLAAGVAVIGLGGLAVAYSLVRQSRHPAEAPPPVVFVAEPPTPTQPPEQVAPSSEVAAPSAKRTVRVAVPEKATVTVDGDPRAVKDGAIELVGALGSKHRVQVTAGKRKAEQQVIITEDGAFPAQVELPKEAAAAPPAHPTGGPTGQVSATPKTTPQHATKFE